MFQRATSEVTVLSPWIANAVVVMVACLTGVNFCAQFVLDAWVPDPYVYGIFMAALPAVIGLRRSERATSSEEAQR